MFKSELIKFNHTVLSKT